MSREVEGCGRKTERAVMVPANFVPHLVEGLPLLSFFGKEIRLESRGIPFDSVKSDCC